MIANPKVSLLLLPLAICLGCSGDGSGENTTGRRITLKTRIDAGAEASRPFGTKQGWTVTLDVFYLATGPFYYFDGATIFSHAAPKGPAPTWFDRLFGIKSAFAHPGHYIPGTARGEMLTPSSVDLHAGPATLATGNGVTGPTRSATFTFGSPPAGAFEAMLGTHAVVLEGTAKKGSETRIFRAELDVSDLRNAKKEPAVVGCLFKEVDMQSDGTVTLTIQPKLWFDEVEFETMPASVDGKPVRMMPDVLARKELVLGVLAGNGYVFSYAP
ncbi:MAG: hypothetical protein U0174_26790 [Polyangiaceae bacterium]